jgi:hypothetical protein
MATATVDSRNRSVNDTATGAFTGDGAATKLTLGFVPARIVVINETDTIRYEKMKGMAAANCLKVIAAGTMTVDTGSLITLNTDGTVTLAAALGVTAKHIVWFAER